MLRRRDENLRGSKFGHTAQIKSCRWQVFMRQAMRLHGNKCVPPHAVPVLVGIDVSEVDAVRRSELGEDEGGSPSNPAGGSEQARRIYNSA